VHGEQGPQAIVFTLDFAQRIEIAPQPRILDLEALVLFGHAPEVDVMPGRGAGL